MTIAAAQPVSKAIDSALSYIPVLWPLQQFIATNPLWDLINQPIDQVGKSLQQFANVETTLALSDYIQLYQQNKISDQAVQHSINTQITQQLSLLTESSLIQIILAFMLDNTQQKNLLSALQIAEANTVINRRILYSEQVNSLCYNNSLEQVKTECFQLLAAYTHPNKTQLAVLRRLNADKTTVNNSFTLFYYYLLRRKNKRWAELLAEFPLTQEPHSLIDKLLTALRVPADCITHYVARIAWQLKGWMGYAKWQHNYPDNPYVDRLIKPEEIILLWLLQEVYLQHELYQSNKNNTKLFDQFKLNYAIEIDTNTNQIINNLWSDYVNNYVTTSTLLLDKTELEQINIEQIIKIGQDLIGSVHKLQWLWQHAYELSYQLPLQQKLFNAKTALSHHVDLATEKKSVPTAQWVFCIDVRSESMRRHLEQLDSISMETYGFAGFFGLAYQLNNYAEAKATCQCPALIQPNIMIDMINASQSLLQQITKRFNYTISANKQYILTPFALYEILGAWYSLALLIKNYGYQLVAAWRKCSEHNLTLQWQHNDLSTMAELAQGLLTGMGLTDNFAEFIMICGHSATTENNPFQAGLDCGACGGNSGVSNAILACELLNHPEIRVKLANNGIVIPNNSQFIPACHNTTTDVIHWYQSAKYLPKAQRDSFKQLQQLTKIASMNNQQERLKQLPGDPNVQRRANHWAELIPEWGLANNAAFIIAPRALTSSLNLASRTFLHSYDADSDSSGAILEAIMLGPVTVAHWINSQYYFSTVCPKHYGSGNKAIHNLLPNIGVMEGNQSDLKYGLPIQSVYFRDQRMHQPLRLFVYVDAPQARINAILDKHESLRQLVQGKWLFIQSLQIANNHN